MARRKSTQKADVVVSEEEVAKVEEETTGEAEVETIVETSDEGTEVETGGEDTTSVETLDASEETNGEGESSEESDEETSQLDTELVDSIDSWEAVGTLLSMDKPILEKIDTIIGSSFIDGKLFTAIFKDYAVDFKVDVDAKIGAARTNRLYKTILSVIREKDANVFKVKFDLINLFFLIYGKTTDAYNVLMLNRFTVEQRNVLSSKEINTFHTITTIIALLADASTRNVEKKNVAGFAANELNVLTEAEVSRIKDYYGMD